MILPCVIKYPPKLRFVLMAPSYGPIITYVANFFWSDLWVVPAVLLL